MTDEKLHNPNDKPRIPFDIETVKKGSHSDGTEEVYRTAVQTYGRTINGLLDIVKVIDPESVPTVRDALDRIIAGTALYGYTAGYSDAVKAAKISAE